jgi:hypothetical protein
MEKHRTVVVTSLEPATSMHTQKPVKAMLDIWPAFLPVVIRSDFDCPSKGHVDNVFAALERSSWVCEISFQDIPSRRSLERLS